MPGCGQWTLQSIYEPNNCWFCDNYSFCLIFWNEEIGIFSEKNSINIDKKTKSTIVETIRIHNNESYMDHEDSPVLFTNVTGWKPRKFMTLLDYLDSLEPSKQLAYDQNALIDAQRAFDFTDLEELNADDRLQVDNYIETRMKHLKQEYVTMRLKQTSRIIKDHLRFK